MKRIFLDANATSAVRPEAIAAVESYFREHKQIKNASSVYDSGRRARTELAKATASIKELLLGDSQADAQLFFTSGGTEGCNAIIHGFIDPNHKGRLLSSAIEHQAMLAPLAALEIDGWQVILVKPENLPIIKVEDYLKELTADTALVSLMLANNETGAIQPVLELAEKLRKSGYSGPIVSDISQAVGKSEVNLNALFRAGVTAVSMSGHKLGALPGVGVVLLAGASYGVCFPFVPLIRGGAQQNDLRSGTENLPGIISLAAVSDYLCRNGNVARQKIAELRENLWNKLTSADDSIVRLTPGGILALSNTLLIHVPGCRGDDLVVSLDLLGVEVSTGSACNSGKQKASHVMLAQGFSKAREVVRLSLDWDADREIVELAAERIIGAIKRVRSS